ncbi:hypothetical protein HDZ31DRAFT_31825 [Schizophyllum fasciatum]
MSAQPLPPLPPNWSEHTGPGGVKYFYNALTHESTYIRPLPALPVPPAAQDRPLAKTRIPGTEWLRVRTAQGRTFYTHAARRASVWGVPDEIRDAVAALDAGGAGARARDEAEVQDAAKRRAVDEPVGEVLVTKRAKVEEEGGEEEDSESDSDEEEEEEWQREAAAQLAKEAAEEQKRREEEERRVQEATEAEARTKQDAQLKMPAHVDLSVEEAKALFKTLLREKDVNPLHPWDLSLPLFVNDPRYVLLASVSARRDAFDEYCRERARELRQAQAGRDRAAASPRDEFDRLLREAVRSTRTSWTDFRRAWKRDRRFYGWGRDEREREKRFRDYLKELGEQKRAAAQKAEADFIALLREKACIQPDSEWKDIKRTLYDDPRYDAVGSSSLREELFNTFKKANKLGAANDDGDGARKDGGDAEQVDQAELERRKKEKKERAVREREEKVRAERQRTELDIARSRQGLTQEEGETQFKVLLVDAIRDPQTTWESAQPELQKDPRFAASPLPPPTQLRLFHAHLAHLRARHLAALHALFAAHAPSLAAPAPAPAALAAPAAAPPAAALGLDARALADEFARWQRGRAARARAAFDAMLAENAFVEFWGRLGKLGGEGAGAGAGVAADALPEGEGEFGGGAVDMKALARGVDVREIVKVIKNDKRYLDFDHVPEEREQWIRDYLANLSAPQLSVHLQKR